MNRCDFEYECSRAELLGVDPLTWDQFMEQQKNKYGQDEDEKLINSEDAKVIHHLDEGIQNTSNELDELNGILAVTQQKINKLKSVCGSLTNLLKLRRSHATEDQTCSSANASISVTPVKKSSNGEISVRMNDRAGSQIDKLDSLIEKAERAEISMSKQNKQMKQFLGK